MDPITTTPQDDILQTNVSPSLPVKRGHPLFKILIGIILLAIGVGVGWLLANNKDKISLSSKQTIASYEECVKAKGSLVQESYPATCVTRDGTRFTQALTDEEKQNLLPPDSTRESASSFATDNWESYANNQYSFSFKYPNKLEAQRVTGKFIFVARDTNFSGGVGSMVPLYLAVSVGDNLDKSPSESWIDELIDTKTLTVSGLTFKEKIYKGDAAEGSKAYTLIASTQKGVRGYFFEFSFYTDGCLSPDQEKLVCDEENKKFINDNYKSIDQILSTFKFLDN